jgi:protein O-mannosyl-transferase
MKPASRFMNSRDQGRREPGRTFDAARVQEPPLANSVIAWLQPLWNRGWFRGGLLIAVTFLVYLPALRCGFIWDDGTLVTENPLIRSPDGLYRFWCTTEAPDYWPLTSTTWWLEWRLWGADPLGYHAINILLHALSAGVWWQILARLRIPGAWLAALLFAIHPVNVESVAWIAERKNTLAMIFFALAILLYVRFEDTARRRWYGLAVGAFALALLSKTAVVMLPFVLLGMAWWRRGKIARNDLWRSLPFFTLAGVLGSVTLWFAPLRTVGMEIVRHDSFWSRLAGAGCAVWFYLYKVVWPVNLCFVYPRWQIDPHQLRSYVPGLLLVAVGAICWRHRLRWGRHALAGLGYYLALLFPALGFVNIYFMKYSLVADHYQYFSLIGVIALLVGGGVAVCRRIGRAGGPVGLLAGVFLGLLLGRDTWNQQHSYRDELTLWQDTLAVNPNTWLAHNNLGLLLRKAGQGPEARVHFEQALRIQPDSAEAHNNLGSVLLDTGSIDDAKRSFEESLRLNPRRAEAHYNLATALVRLGQPEEAARHYEEALRIKPDYVEAHNNLGNVLLQMNRAPEAIAHYRSAIQLKPDDVEAHYNLGVALLSAEQPVEAAEHFRRALAAMPDSAQVHFRLGQALRSQHDAAAALTEYQRTLELDPNHVPARLNMAWILATAPEAVLRNGERAVELAQQAQQLSLPGSSPQLLDTLAAACAEAGRFPEAVEAARHALRLAAAENDAALVESLQARLQRYQDRQPCREEP